MKRYQFDRIVRSVAAITGNPDVLVIGSQAVVGVYGDIVDEKIAHSNDLDVSDLNGNQRFIHEIAGTLGELSPFQDSNDGAYADSVVAEEVATLPSGWRDRLIKVETTNLITPEGVQARAWCLHPNDVIASKLAAGRDKDRAFAEAAVDARLDFVNQQAIEDALADIANHYPKTRENVTIGLELIRRAFENTGRRT